MIARLSRLRQFGLAYAWAKLRLKLKRQNEKTDYATWISLFDRKKDFFLKKEAKTFLKFSVITIQPNEDTINAVISQAYQHWEMCVGLAEPKTFADQRIRTMTIPPNTQQPENLLLDLATGDVIVPLSRGDILAPSAFHHLARESADLIYSDEDRLIDGVRCDPLFKPDFSPELLHDPSSIGRLVAWRRGPERFRAEAEELAVYDMLLRLSERARTIRHIPRILIHRAPQTPPRVALWQHLLAEHLARTGDEAHPEPAPGPAMRLRRSLPEPPPVVSVLIPTRDRAVLLETCVSGLLHRTDYPNLEVLIIDNASTDPDAIALLARLAQDPRIKILQAPGPFNYAAMNNQGAAAADGEILALLNNDIAVRDPGWLHEMVAHAVLPAVGAVGAKLLYADGTIQHAGVATGLFGVAGHLHRGLPDGLPGYGGRLCRVQTVGAVTGACMVLRRAVFLDAGGLDATSLPVSYNDVDLCLRLRARGLRIVFTPFAVLDHLESASRGDDLEPEHAARARREADVMIRRWGRALEDPYYNCNLSLQSEQFALAFPPRREVSHDRHDR